MSLEVDGGFKAKLENCMYVSGLCFKFRAWETSDNGEYNFYHWLDIHDYEMRKIQIFQCILRTLHTMNTKGALNSRWYHSQIGCSLNID